MGGLGISIVEDDETEKRVNSSDIDNILKRIFAFTSMWPIALEFSGNILILFSYQGCFGFIKYVD